MINKNLVVPPYLYTDGQHFSRTRSFIYLSSLANDKSDITEETRTWIQNSNKCYELQNHFKS